MLNNLKIQFIKDCALYGYECSFCQKISESGRLVTAIVCDKEDFHLISSYTETASLSKTKLAMQSAMHAVFKEILRNDNKK